MSRINSIVLPPLSKLYGAITKSRLGLYRRGTFRSLRLNAPVISVGNITVGGTGKTPLVEWVAEFLASEGKRVCILTRGYKRRNPGEHVLVSDGEKVLSNPFDAGDEAFQLATRLVGKAAVISNANRFAAGEGAIRHLRSNCFVLDDGFQHLQLARDLDIVTIDATDPWGGGQLLPFGRLREPKSGLSRAGCAVLTRIDQTNDADKIRSEVLSYLGNRPIFTSQMVTVDLEPVNSTTAEINEHPKACFAFCGIGNPTAFVTQLTSTTLEMRGSKTYPDHHNYTEEDMRHLVSDAQRMGADCLVTTEKDAVKLRELSCQIPLYFIRISIEINNSAELKQLLREAAQASL